MEVGYERFAAAYPCPLRRDGQLLCDGAYADIAPIDVARSFGHPAVVAVDAGQALVSEIRNGYQALTPAVEIRRHGGFRHLSKSDREEGRWRRARGIRVDTPLRAVRWEIRVAWLLRALILLTAVVHAAQGAVL